jgi:nucleoside-triphosphatase THEP1
MFVQDIPVPHEDGSFVSEKVSRIIELIHEYSDKLEVRWIHPRERTNGEAAFIIVELCQDGKFRTAFTIQDEDDFDERILARIYAADQEKHGDVRIKIDDMNRARQALKAKEEAEQLEELNSITRFMIGTPKHRVQLSKNKFINL